MILRDTQRDSEIFREILLIHKTGRKARMNGGRKEGRERSGRKEEKERAGGQKKGRDDQHKSTKK